jgi:hypothetical protein
MPAVTGAAAGHPSIRATHRKTLELTRDQEITERATCVVGVATRLDEDALAELHGAVALTLATGDESVTVRGRLNPAFQPGDPLVARRAPDVTRNAVIVEADTAAEDLPRSFVERLAQPGVDIAVTVVELPDEPAPGVLVATGADPGAVAAAHDAGHSVLPHPSLEGVAAVLAVAGAPGAEVVEDLPAERVAKLLRRSGAERAVIALDQGTPREQFLPWRAGETPDIPGARGRRATVAIVYARTPDT